MNAVIIGSNKYKLILLDTNALREIISENSSCKGFFEKFLNKGNAYAPCFSIYNVIELMPYNDLYERFLTYFSIIPCFMFFSVRQIIQEEYRQYIKGQAFQVTNQTANAFTPAINNDRYNCRKALLHMQNDQQLMHIIQQEVYELHSVADFWKQQRADLLFFLQSKRLSLGRISDEFYILHEKEAIIKDLKNWGIAPKDNLDITALPSLRIMEYSHFNRIYLTSKKVLPNDAMDIKICCITPYVDAVITEKFQANVYKKAKNLIPQMQQIEIYTLVDIRKLNSGAV